MKKASSNAFTSPILNWYAISDQGRVRQENQDAYYGGLKIPLFIVSDGMGGHQAGKLASEAVVSVLPDMVKRKLDQLSSTRGRAIHCVLRDSVVQLSQQLFEQSSKRIGVRGMGATLVMALLHNRRAYILNMGDSRAYILRRGQLSQLTEDHSVIGILLRRGEITAEQAKTHPARGQLSRYVGMQDVVYPDVKSIAIKKGDRLLLCTDGLTGMIKDQTIARLISKKSEPQMACQALIDAANAAGGHDNITVLIMDWLGFKPSEKT